MNALMQAWNRRTARHAALRLLERAERCEALEPSLAADLRAAALAGLEAARPPAVPVRGGTVSSALHLPTHPLPEPR